MGITPHRVPAVNTATCSVLNARRHRYLTLAPRQDSLLRPQRPCALQRSGTWYLTTSTPQDAQPKHASQPTHSTWPRGIPSSTSEPRVGALPQENATLLQQLTAQSSQIAAQKTQIDSLQAQLLALEEKTLEGCTSKRRRPNTPIKSLHVSEKVQVAINATPVDLEKRLDSRFNYVTSFLLHNTKL
ncbi:hypothetical protein HPB52_006555 [Rhipicephalus sanguineus]|uniref:Uncharacterized protein n=1 Tax=Rhipicephalus sanguineus TaxID=34632 RepID=A0A9D4QGZ8_RHISA|nr:hypothetical protein HPB52_006555 [Rhipicephalus sanguineus]